MNSKFQEEIDYDFGLKNDPLVTTFTYFKKLNILIDGKLDMLVPEKKNIENF